ncbi:MAG: aspartate kinase [bacterium]
MIVMKFGGASLSDAKNIEITCKIVRDYQRNHKVVLIVSAMQGVTDQLFEIVELLKKKKGKAALTILIKIKLVHFATLDEISDSRLSIRTKIELSRLFYQLEYYLKNIVQKEITPARADYIVSWGERASCRIVTEALENAGMPAYALDASTFLATNDDFGNAVPIYVKSQKYIQQILLPLIENDIIPVVTGYIGFTHDGCTTTLGRGGSDLSAAFIANFLDADGLYLWKDVAGFYDKDPHKEPKAKKFTKLSYNQAEKLCLEGAKVIYYKAIEPVRKKKIPIYVKSFLDPQESGSVVGGK